MDLCGGEAAKGLALLRRVSGNHELCSCFSLADCPTSSNFTLLPPATSCRAPFYKIMVPTVDTVRYHFLVKALVLSQYPVLLTGPVGTGKTSVAQSVLGGLTDRWTGLTINMSSQVGVHSNPDAHLTSESRRRSHGFSVLPPDHGR